ncbi:MAG: tRNA (N6-isopentenyl adenosine(37)-C2)-methylthiotransferase MiaB [Candidatus Omnitrophica bacterium]|nr:tRNA (N6-isopentenyl adenosine(37)-C2)-methylthiotransferase MiaB [Candidatus Omnitrophota bacterium]
MTNKNDTQKRVFLATFGCQMNEYDSEIVISILKNAGYEITPEEQKADIILLNTCSVRENAHRKVYGQLDILREEFGKEKVIGILGCMATALKEELLENKNIDFIAGPDSYKKLPEIIAKASKHKEKPFDTDLSALETYGDIHPSKTNSCSAYIAIMRGCDNFCSFCIVPYARGRERSRSTENILTEAEGLASKGVKQITLLGQNVNSYHYDIKSNFISSDRKANGATHRIDEKAFNFTRLIEEISKIEQIKRIRFMSPHPKDFPEELIELLKENPKLCKHVHLPLQAGNNRILKLMNRKYTSKDFLKLVDKLRKASPEITLTTDVIIGFPSETKPEFNDTFKLMKAVEFDSAFIFKYSPRKGTLAEQKYEDDITPDEKTERIVKLNELQKRISLKKNQALIGRTFEIMIEAEGTAKSDKDIQGRTDGNKLVIIPKSNQKIGDFLKVEITDATANVLKGRPY